MKIIILLVTLLLVGCKSTGSGEQLADTTDLPMPDALKAFVYNSDGKGYWIDIALTDSK